MTCKQLEEHTQSRRCHYGQIDDHRHDDAAVEETCEELLDVGGGQHECDDALLAGAGIA